MVKRRKMLIGMGALASGSAAAMGTGAFEGAYVNTDRDLSIATTVDTQANLGLIPSSQYASLSNYSSGGWEGGDGGSPMLDVDIDNLNNEADTRLDDVFRVKNNTGSEMTVLVEDNEEWGATSQNEEDTLQVWAQRTNGGTDVGSAVRLDDGNGSIDLAPGEVVEINIFVLLKTYQPNGFPPGGSTAEFSLTFTADGTDN
jgi:type 1 fimbria pilin